MVQFNEPKSLYDLCHNWYAAYLGDKILSARSDNATLSSIRHKLRPFFLDHIPVLVRTSLLEETADFLTSNRSIERDYGRSVLYLLNLLLSPEVRRLRVALCCYYGCRDMEGVLRCIKKNGASLEYLELSRSSLLRMDPLLFRNVLTSASHLNSLVVKNVCSDAMLKLIGTHCPQLQFLDIASSKQVSDLGIEWLCCQVQFRDKRVSEENPAALIASPIDSKHIQIVSEEYSDGDRGIMNKWRNLRQRIKSCITSPGMSANGQASTSVVCTQGSSTTDGAPNVKDEDVFVEIKQVLSLLCNTLRSFDISDTSVTNSGLLVILKNLSKLQSVGEYSISDNFVRGLNIASSMNVNKFGLLSAHTRKTSEVGMYNVINYLPGMRSLTCWEPEFGLTDLAFLVNLRQLTLLRINYCQGVMQQLQRYVESSSAANMDKICLEFMVQDDFPAVNNNNHNNRGNEDKFDLAKIFTKCRTLKVFSVEFKDSLMASPVITYDSPVNHHLAELSCLSTLVHVQLGQLVHNDAVRVILQHCDKLKHFHCNSCPNLTDANLAAFTLKSASAASLECFYIYDAPELTVTAFQVILDAFPNLLRFGNLTRWALNCEGIQHVVRTIKSNNFNLEILCGSHWFMPRCSKMVKLSSFDEDRRISTCVRPNRSWMKRVREHELANCRL